MENAIMETRLNKQGKLCGEIIFEDKKSLPIPGWLIKDISSEQKGKECQVQREKGQPVKVIIDGKEYKRSAPQQSQGASRHAGRRPDSRGRRQAGQAFATPPGRQGQHEATSTGREAVAPYNFVPINEKIVYVDEEPYPMDRYSIDENPPRLSGEIVLNIETLTPFFIRGTIKTEDLSREDEIIDHDFFAPGGRLRIPGSSLRGMIRNLVEIAGYGKFENFDGDRRLYYRFIAEPPPLGDEYRGRILNAAANHFPKIKAGFLIKSKTKPGTYEIKPSRKIAKSQFYRVNYNRNSGSLDCNAEIRLHIRKDDNYCYQQVYFAPVPPTDNSHKNGRLTLRYPLVSQVYPEKPATASTKLYKGYLVYSGRMPNKRMQWIINEPSNNTSAKVIPPKVVEDYNNDESRKSINLLSLADKRPQGVPCFYLTNANNEIVSFGHTGMFRLAYDKSIAEHLPPCFKKKIKKYDLIESIFGEKGKFVSRVFFEDAELITDDKDPYLVDDYKHPKILSTPRPTTVQHYLKQGIGTEHSVVNRNNLASWNSDKHIRGYKLYWHRDINSQNESDLHSWVARADQVLKYPKQYEYKIKPLKNGVIFKGAIRFENLLNHELGALLFVLDLPEKCCHKLGLAKPLGFGSIRIKPELFLVNRTDRYKKLFNQNQWYPAEEQGDLNSFKKTFANYILGKLGITKDKDEADALWQEKRMVELKRLLTWYPGDQNWLNTTRYMDISGQGLIFRDRPVLPEPSQVRGNQ